ncbi:LysR substrate-binding domain-containing protein [Bradyrhizobium sp. SRL28]|uniref:LysR substrate-binding domain-containing protein n=1 Tax=Bradyrhizobium sp. SRL28 TaxID=2836178 RepID=UPI00201BC1F3|nr:LysR substrate-binding domain-containing protein [Bradyrhizobium sp. SRL28]
MMQYRHLHYFVSVVEAGSFSRAASTIHVAQPAISQQIAQLEEQLGVSLLLRSARGVRPTAAGEVLYREASSILKRLQQLPGIVRSGTGTAATGVVRLGMSSTFVTTAPAAFMEQCKASLPNVELRMAVSDSPTIKRRVTAHELDLGLVLEDELAPTFARMPLFRQKLFLIRPQAASKGRPVQLADLVSLPLILPPSPNVTRTALDRAFAKAKLSPDVVMEADVVANIIAAVRADVGGAVLPKGDLSDMSGEDLGEPEAIEPPVYLTCSIISSGNFPLANAAEAVRDLLSQFVEATLHQTQAPGVEWIDATGA